MLSRYRPAELRSVVAAEDIMALTLVPGIGKKTAQHVFLELKYKLKMGDSPKSAAVSAAPGSVFADTIQGLSNLGYSEEETRPVLSKVLQDEPDLDVAGALRMCLKALARGLRWAILPVPACRMSISGRAGLKISSARKTCAPICVFMWLPRANAARPWIMCFSTVIRAWEKPLWPVFWLLNWV
jgi:hypothetical protein